MSCCPPNVARTLASLAAYIATVDDDGIQLHQYAPARIRTSLPDGRRRSSRGVDRLSRATGAVGCASSRTPGPTWTLSLRVPAWAEGATSCSRRSTASHHTVRRARLGVRDSLVSRSATSSSCTSRSRRRFTAADPRIDAVRGCVAVERGPEVLCLESTDLLAVAGEVEDVSLVEIDGAVPPREVDGRVVVRLRPKAEDGAISPWPYGSDADVDVDSDSGGSTPVDVPLIAYHDWANRGPSTMRVWIPVSS